MRDRKYCSMDCFRKLTKGKKRPEQSKKMKELHKKGRMNTQGFKGKTHSKEHNKKASERLKSFWKDKNHMFNSKEYRQLLSDNTMKMCASGKMNIGYSRAKNGYYNINGKKIYFRSSWEANYALYLNFLIKQKQIKKWEFEVDTFWFEKIRRGVRSYKPDFKVFKNNGDIEYHEVKGWMDLKSKTKLKRMKIYHPEIKMVLIDKEFYKDLKNKLGKLLKFF